MIPGDISQIGNVTLQTILQGEPIFSSGITQAILQASISGAGLIFAIYAFILPISEDFFKQRIDSFKKDVEKWNDEIIRGNPTQIFENFDALNNIRSEIKDRKKLPRWINKKIAYAFLGYILSSIISLGINIFNYHGVLDIMLLFTFLFSTIIFGWIGVNGLFEIYDYILSKYNSYIKKVDDEQPLNIPISPEQKLPPTPSFDIEFEEEYELAFYNFEDDKVGAVPHGWTIEINESGKIEVTDNTGADDTKKSLKIQTPANSRSIIYTTFPGQEKLSVTYNLRIDKFGDHRGVGIALMFYQDESQAIWMAVTRKKLMGFWEGSYNEISEIRLKKWYKIKIDIDCEKSEYICYVDDEQKIIGKFRTPVYRINKIKTPGWFKQAERLGYLDEIKILRYS